jgi:hypothetical protein
VPVLKGLPGTGKGILANAYGALWRPHYVTMTHRDQVSGKFNAHTFGRRFVFVDEGTFGGDRSSAGVLKTRVTEESQLLELKGVDPILVPNRSIYMIASNEASIVPADVADRRWAVFEVGDKSREDRTFFGALRKQLENGGFKAMLFDLLHHNIAQGPNPRIAPKTEGLTEQMMRSLPSDIVYLYGLLNDGILPQSGLIDSADSTTIEAMGVRCRIPVQTTSICQNRRSGNQFAALFRQSEPMKMEVTL